MYHTPCLNACIVTIILNFNLAVDSTSASQKSNYSIEPALKIENVFISKNNNSQVELAIKNQQKSDCQFIITVKNIFSKSGIPIKKGQGSQTLLIFPRTDLTEVYTYPNPCRLGAGHESITFANLSQNEIIKILTVSGKVIRTLKKTNNNIDLVWDLKNDRGELVSSGIYVYSVLKSNGNQLGKLAVVR